MRIAPVTRRLAWLIGLVALLTAVAGAWVWFENNPARLRAQAQAALEQKQFDRAAGLIALLKKKQLLTSDDWMLDAQADIGRNRGDEALEALGHIADDHPSALQARMMEAYIALYEHRAALMERSLKRALKLQSKLIQAHRELAKLYETQGRRADLGREFGALAELTRLTYDDLFAWCRSASSDREPGLAAETLRAYVLADPEDRPSRLALADHLRRLGQLDEAETALGPLGAGDADAQLLRAEIARDRGDLAAAEALVRPLQANLPALRLRGLLALDQQRPDEAARWFRQALDRDPDDRDTLFGLGQALRLLGHKAEAERFLKAAWARDELEVQLERSAATGAKSSAEVFRALGGSCLAVGRIGQARAWYQLAVAANPLDTEAQQALHDLSQPSQSAQPANSR